MQGAPEDKCLLKDSVFLHSEEATRVAFCAPSNPQIRPISACQRTRVQTQATEGRTLSPSPTATQPAVHSCFLH